MSDVPRERIVVPDEDEWTPDRILGLKCVRRESGAWCHVFLDDSNICRCKTVNLNAYREAGLR
jgi:hypothetical protein